MKKITFILLTIILFLFLVLIAKNTMPHAKSSPQKTAMALAVSTEETVTTVSVSTTTSQPAIPIPICNLNKQIGEGKIRAMSTDTSLTQKYLRLRPRPNTLDRSISQHIHLSPNDAYDKFFLLEKQDTFSSFIQRHESRDGFVNVHLTTLDNETCDLIDQVLLEERDTVEGEMTGTISLKITPSHFLTTFYEEDIDYNNIDFWERDSFKVSYEIDSNGLIQEYNHRPTNTDSLLLQ